VKNIWQTRYFYFFPIRHKNNILKEPSCLYFAISIGLDFSFCANKKLGRFFSVTLIRIMSPSFIILYSIISKHRTRSKTNKTPTKRKRTIKRRPSRRKITRRKITINIIATINTQITVRIITIMTACIK